jgi:hypothetical protein
VIKHRVNRRIFSRAAAAGVVGLLLAADARALLVYEPFNYTGRHARSTPRSNPIDGQPWSVMSNNAADDDILLNSGSVTYSGLVAPVGNSVGFSGTGKSSASGLTRTVRAGTLYYSLAFRLTSLGAMTSTTPVIIGGFSDRSGASGTPPTTVGARLYLKTSTNSTPGNEKFNIGVSKNDTFNIAWDTTTDYTLNTPIFVIGSYQGRRRRRRDGRPVENVDQPGAGVAGRRSRAGERVPARAGRGDGPDRQRRAVAGGVRAAAGHRRARGAARRAARRHELGARDAAGRDDMGRRRRRVRRRHQLDCRRARARPTLSRASTARPRRAPSP